MYTVYFKEENNVKHFAQHCKDFQSAIDYGMRCCPKGYEVCIEKPDGSEYTFFRGL